ncbi:MAG: hypothetical protein SGPRY_009036 [Prymnesium sp.]
MGLWLRYALRRGPAGLGIDVDGQNAIIQVRAHGQAASDGVAREGDVVVSVDGVPLEGCKLVDALAHAQESYIVTVWRADCLQMEEQARVTLGGGRRDAPLALVYAKVRRGADGLGLDIGEHSQVIGLVPGSLAEQDGIVQPDDVIAGVDGTCVSWLVACTHHLRRLISTSLPLYQQARGAGRATLAHSTW